MSNDIKINVKADADLGGISAAMDKLNQKAVDLQSTLGKTATIGVDNTQALTKIKEVGQADEEAKRRVSGVPASSTSERPEELSIKRQQQQLKALTEEVRKHTNLKRELNEVDLKAYSNATKRMAHSGSAFGAYAAAAGDDPKKLAELSPAASKHALASTGFVDPSNKTKTGAAVASPYGGKLASAAIGMAGGMVAGGAGGDGLALAGSALGGMVGSVFGPVGSMIGGALGGFAGGIVGGGLGEAKEEAVGMTDLRHSLSATTTDFTQLRDSVRAASYGMGMTSLEAGRLAKQFAHTANTQSKDAGSLADEIRLASGLSRSFGVDPSQGVGAMSALRNTHATSNEADSRKMAMTIAESIAKNGMGSKGDEVLSAIASFAQSSARASLQAPNAGGYTDFLGRMTGMKTPGLDVQGSASLMSKADAGIRAHGDEATDTFKLAAFMRAFKGFKGGAMDLQLYTSVGAMGTAGTMADDILKDKNSSEERKATARLVKSSGNANRPLQDIMMQQLKEQYIGKDGKKSSEYELSGARLLGMEQGEFRKFSNAYETQGSTGGMQKELNRILGSKAGGLASSKFGHMATLLGSSGSELKEESDRLISGKGYDKQLSDQEKREQEKLGSADLSKKENVDKLRESIIKLNADREQIDEGAQARQGIADVKQAVINLSSTLIPAVNAVRDAILMVNGGTPDKLSTQQKEWVTSAEKTVTQNNAVAKWGKWANSDKDKYIRGRNTLINKHYDEGVAGQGSPEFESGRDAWELQYKAGLAELDGKKDEAGKLRKEAASLKPYVGGKVSLVSGMSGAGGFNSSNKKLKRDELPGESVAGDPSAKLFNPIDVPWDVPADSKGMANNSARPGAGSEAISYVEVLLKSADNSFRPMPVEFKFAGGKPIGATVPAQ